MTVEDILQEAEQREKEVCALRKLWSVNVGKHIPSVVQMNTWLALHSFDAVVEGVRISAVVDEIPHGLALAVGIPMRGRRIPVGGVVERFGTAPVPRSHITTTRSLIDNASD